MHATQLHTSRAVFFALVCVVLWACIPVVSRLGQEQLDHFQFLFWSSVLSLVVVTLYAWWVGKIHHLRQYTLRQAGIALGLGVLGSFVYYVLLYFGYARAQGMEVIALQYTWPVWITLLAALLLRERISWRHILGSALGLVGVVMVVTRGDISQIHLANVWVDFLVLLGAFTFGLFSVLSKKANLDATTAPIFFFAAATTASALTLPLVSSFALPTTLSVVLPVVINGAVVNGLSYVLWLAALRAAPASRIAPLVFLTPVLATLLTVWIFDDTFMPVYVIALVCVLGAGFLTL